MKVVIYSSSEEKSTIQKSYDGNADLYMVKPQGSAHLKSAFETVLNKAWWEEAPPKTHYFINNGFLPVAA